MYAKAAVSNRPDGDCRTGGHIIPRKFVTPDTAYATHSQCPAWQTYILRCNRSSCRPRLVDSRLQPLHVFVQYICHIGCLCDLLHNHAYYCYVALQLPFSWQRTITKCK